MKNVVETLKGPGVEGDEETQVVETKNVKQVSPKGERGIILEAK